MNSHMNFIKEQLYTLTSIQSPSSFTAKVTDYLLSELSSLGYSPERSNKGNVFVTLGGSGSPLVLAAHVDTLGAMVRSIKENGRQFANTVAANYEGNVKQGNFYARMRKYPSARAMYLAGNEIPEKVYDLHSAASHRRNRALRPRRSSS